MAPKWNYFFSIDGILGDVHRGDDASDRLEGSVLSLYPPTPEQPRYVAVLSTGMGTQTRWSHPSKLLIAFMKSAKKTARVRLNTSNQAWGIHVDLHLDHFHEALTGAAVSAGMEVSLTRLIMFWRTEMYVKKNKPLPPLLTHVPVRKCRIQLTDWQTRAVRWMVGMEQHAGRVITERDAVPVPATDHVFAFGPKMFLATADAAPIQHIVMTAGALTGTRGSGKTLVVRQLLLTAPQVPTYLHFQHNDHNATLLVAPDHLVGHWKHQLGSSDLHVCTATSEDTMRPVLACVTSTTTRGAATPPPHQLVVIATYSFLEHMVVSTNRTYQSALHQAIQHRKLNVTPTLVTIGWKRIIYDEAGTSASAFDIIQPLMRTQFTWVLQGGATVLEETSLVNKLYPGLHCLHMHPFVRRLVYSALPQASRLYHVADAREVCLYACETQSQLMAISEDVLAVDDSAQDKSLDCDRSWYVYMPSPQHVLNVNVCASWDHVATLFSKTQTASASSAVTFGSGSQEQVEVFMEGESENDDDMGDTYDGDADVMARHPTTVRTSFDDQLLHVENDHWFSLLSSASAWNMDISINGVHMSFENGPNPDTTLQPQTVNASAFFTHRLDQLVRLGCPPPADRLCKVCLDHTCNVLLPCGHMLCCACTMQLLHQNSDVYVTCPECRAHAHPHNMYMVIPSYVPVSVTWIHHMIQRCASSHTNVVFVGDSEVGIRSLKTRFATSQRLFIHSHETLGDPMNHVDVVVLLGTTVEPLSLREGVDLVQLKVKRVTAH